MMRFSVKVAILSVTTLVLVLVLASAVYGAAPVSDPVTVNVQVNDFISISNPGDVTLAAIAGTGGSSESNATWQVATNNDAGYKLEIAATGSPAMTKGTDSFADYSGVGVWSIPAAQSAFGFSVNNTSSYQGFTGAIPIQVRNSTNETAGEDTIINFKAEVGASHLQASGAYSANLTVTATTL
ncbi:MAG: hypothetical protein WC911_10125 [Thermoleophilia bacterium]